MFRYINVIIMICYLLCLCSCNKAVDESKIIQMGQYKGYTCEYQKQTVNMEQLILDIEQAYRITSAELYKITDRDVIESNDFVSVEYDVLMDGVKISETQIESFKVGAGYFLLDLEQALIGKKLNEQYNIQITLPSDYPTLQLANKTVTFIIMATEIFNYNIPEMTDEYFINMGYLSYNDYLDSQIEAKKMELAYIERKEIGEMILHNVIDNSTFEISSDDINNKYQKIIKEYENYAQLYDLSLNDYVISVLEFSDIDSFFDQCLFDAEYELKRDLIIEALKKAENINPTDNEIIDIAVEKYQYPRDSVYDMKGQLREYVEIQLLYDLLITNSYVIYTEIKE